VIAGGVTKAQEQWIVERVGLGALGRIRGEREVDQLVRLADGQRPEDERVDQRKRRQARAEGQRQGRHGGASHDGVLAQHACTKADIAPSIEPRQELDVAARSRSRSGLRTGAPLRVAASRVIPAAINSCMRVDVELQFLVELGLDPPARNTFADGIAGRRSYPR
jgi:hypothetical protein